MKSQGKVPLNEEKRNNGKTKSFHRCLFRFSIKNVKKKKCFTNKTREVRLNIVSLKHIKTISLESQVKTSYFYLSLRCDA